MASPARYEEEIKKASGYLQNAIDRGYSTRDKWEAEIEKSKTELRKIEANIPLYRDILTTIFQEPERLKFLAKTRIKMECERKIYGCFSVYPVWRYMDRFYQCTFRLLLMGFSNEAV